MASIYGYKTEVLWLLSYGLQLLTVLRVLTREQREPASRTAWIFFIMAVPGFGMGAYFLFGETGFGRKSVARLEHVTNQLPKQMPLQGNPAKPITLPLNFRQAFARANSVNGFETCGGNSGQLLADSNVAIDAIVKDIDQAKDHVHLMFYIWLSDTNGTKVIEAVKRAATRGVTCRCMIDGMGSNALSKSTHWREMQQAGVKTAITFSLRFLLLHIFFGRVDVRNHRKIVVIDNTISYCGSQNCADPEFAPKANYGPWVDVMVRLTGPLVWQQQNIFASDWITHAHEDISHYLTLPVEHPAMGFAAVAIGTSPTANFNAVPDIFQNLMASAQDEIVITTPYFVPSEALHQRISAAAVRGVTVKFIVPERNDSAVVAWASHSYYLPLLRAGVQMYEFQGGLLHSKTMVVDGQAVFWGSANLDRRSFDINFENCILAIDPDLAAQFVARQNEYLAQSRRISLNEVENWSTPVRVRNNLVATMGPLL